MQLPKLREDRLCLDNLSRWSGMWSILSLPPLKEDWGSHEIPSLSVESQGLNTAPFVTTIPSANHSGDPKCNSFKNYIQL